MARKRQFESAPEAPAGTAVAEAPPADEDFVGVPMSAAPGSAELTGSLPPTAPPVPDLSYPPAGADGGAGADGEGNGEDAPARQRARAIYTIMAYDPTAGAQIALATFATRRKALDWWEHARAPLSRHYRDAILAIQRLEELP